MLENPKVSVAQRLDVVLELPSSVMPGAYPIFAVVEGDSMDEHVLQSVLVVVIGGPEHIPPPNTFSTVPRDAPGMMRGALELGHRAWTPLRAPSGPVKKFALNLTGKNSGVIITTPDTIPLAIPDTLQTLLRLGIVI